MGLWLFGLMAVWLVATGACGLLVVWLFGLGLVACGFWACCFLACRFFGLVFFLGLFAFAVTVVRVFRCCFVVIVFFVFVLSSCHVFCAVARDVFSLSIVCLCTMDSHVVFRVRPMQQSDAAM